MTLFGVVRIDVAKRGRISGIPNVVRDCDRQEFVIRTKRGVQNIRRGDVVVRLGRSVTIIPFSGLLLDV